MAARALALTPAPPPPTPTPAPTSISQPPSPTSSSTTSPFFLRSSLLLPSTSPHGAALLLLSLSSPQCPTVLFPFERCLDLVLDFYWFLLSSRWLGKAHMRSTPSLRRFSCIWTRMQQRVHDQGPLTFSRTTPSLAQDEKGAEREREREA